MRNTNMIRIGGICGFLLSIMMVVAFALDMALVQTTGGQPLLNPDNIGPELLRAKGSAIWPLEGWVYTLMIVPALAFIPAVYRVLREDDRGLADVGLFASVLFWVFHTLHNIAALTVVQVLAPHYAPGTPQGVATEGIAQALLGLANLIFGFGTSVGGLFLAIFLLAYGLIMLRSSNIPRWMGYVALVAGFAVVLSYLQFLSIAFTFIGLAGWVLTIVWVISTTILLLRPASQSHMIAAATS